LDGEKIALLIRRLQCKSPRCKKIHHELPDKAVPYKRYEAKAVETIIEAEDFKKTDCPCEQSTSIRIKTWYSRLREYYESTLQAVEEMNPQSKEMIKKSRKAITERVSGWLCMLVRMVVNSGRWIQTRSASRVREQVDKIAL